MQQAVSLLARREHSSRELRDKLRARSFSAEAVESALATLREQDLQSDHRFAHACTRSLMDRGYGSLRVAGELRERGVSGEIAGEFESVARAGEFERACEALRRKTGTRQQQLRFLAQRGYPGAVARRAVDQAVREDRDD